MAITALAAAAPPGELLPGMQRSPWFGEQVCEERLPSGVRYVINAPEKVDAARPTRVVFYATPNGNTIEQTLGAETKPGDDWHYDIQHVAAQVRRLREVDPEENLILVCLEAEGKSWPAWRQRTPDNAAQIRSLVQKVADRFPGKPRRLVLTGHSGGGSFLFGYLNGGETIPDEVERIAFLDANYSYSDTDRHGDKLIAWLGANAAHRLLVVAYDDRNITLNGKPVLGPTGGTYRATDRMLERFRKETEVRETRTPTVASYEAWSGRFRARVAVNPENRILHTALVGEWNGLLYVLADGTLAEAKWGTFGGPRAYTRWVQPRERPVSTTEAVVPNRPADAPGGVAFMERIAPLAPVEREVAIAAEVLRGNVPEFLRKFVPVRLQATDADGKSYTAELQVMPDYLSIGSDTDWVRVPMTPGTAQQIADRFGWVLTTRKIADAVHAQATVKLEPRPLTEEREAVMTFLRHHRIIEEQRAGKPLGALVAGIKKDVVITNRLQERPNRVAIYGWHYPDGKPIQPLTIVHRASYVDYSHGVRFVSDRVLVDGKPRSLREVLKDPVLAALVSDEGPIGQPRY